MEFERVKLLAPDLSAAASFYHDKLQIPILSATRDLLELAAGSTRLVFQRAGEAMPGHYHLAFNIPENQFAESKAWLSKRTPLHRGPSGEDEFHFEGWNANACYFFDPAGNVLEFIARHTLANASSRPFDGSHILAVSEVSAPARNILDLAGRLTAELGVDVYGEGSDSFAAVGDDHGLFIVVPNGREWFPNTGILAAPLPAWVTVRRAPGFPSRLLSFPVSS
jgi:catechol-2,3-dioxygenase